MQKYKKWLRRFLLFLIAGLLVAVCLVVVIDPFFYYHKPLRPAHMILDMNEYQGAGIIRNFDYETLILGNSIVQNMRPSYAESLTGRRAVKVTLYGRSMERMCETIRLAVRKNPHLREVILNVDVGIMNQRIADETDPFPEYLYDRNPFNDVRYVLNKDVIGKYAFRTLLTRREADDLDTAFSSEITHWFAEYAAVQTKTNPYSSISSVEENVMFSIRCMQKVFSENRAVTFRVFISPRSILYLHERDEEGVLEKEVAFLRQVYETLSAVENVEIYCFQDDEEIIGNLNHYCDDKHFSGAVSDQILRAISAGEYRLTPDNYRERFDHIIQIEKTFDYSVFDAKAYPFKAQTDAEKYLDETKDYVVIAAAQTTFEPDAEWLRLLRRTGAADAQGRVVSGAFYAGDSYILPGLEIDGDAIRIDGVDYALHLPDVQFVIYDPQTDRVMDSAAFDAQTHTGVHARESRRKDE